MLRINNYYRLLGKTSCLLWVSCWTKQQTKKNIKALLSLLLLLGACAKVKAQRHTSYNNIHILHESLFMDIQFIPSEKNWPNVNGLNVHTFHISQDSTVCRTCWTQIYLSRFHGSWLYASLCYGVIWSRSDVSISEQSIY